MTKMSREEIGARLAIAAYAAYRSLTVESARKKIPARSFEQLKRGMLAEMDRIAEDQKAQWSDDLGPEVSA